MNRLPPRVRLRNALASGGRVLREENRAIALGVASVALAIFLFTAAGQDDTYITYWPAKTLAEHGAILNYNGDRIEQSSSLALVVVLAALYKLLPLSMITVGYATGLAFLIVTLALASRVARLAGLPRPHLVAPAIGTVSCVLYWSTSGMETTLTTACELWVVLELSRLTHAPLDRRALLSLFACTAFAATRPESPLVLVAMVGGLGAAALAARAHRGPQAVRSGRAERAARADASEADDAREAAEREPSSASAFEQEPAETPASEPERAEAPASEREPSSARAPASSAGVVPAAAPASEPPPSAPPSEREPVRPRANSPSSLVPTLPSFAAFQRIALVAAGGIGLVLAFRFAYFHAWVPNPATMKAPGFDLEGGAFYAWRCFHVNGLHLLAIFVLGVGTIFGRAARGRLRSAPAALVASLAAAHLGFIVVSGGDWMSSSRFLAPLIPSLILTGILALAPLLKTKRALSAVVALLITANLLCTLHVLHSGEGEGRPLWTNRHLGQLLERRIGPNEFSPIERANKLHLRDAVPLHKFLEVVDKAQATTDRPLWVMTGQAGMMGYYLMSRHFGRVKMHDLWSLTTRELYDCMPRSETPGTKWGSAMVLDKAFQTLSRNGARCGIGGLPDLYYNECISPDRREALERYGYVILYEQQGWVKHSRRSKYFGGQIEACGHYAVRRELAERLHLKAEPPWEWNIVPR